MNITEDEAALYDRQIRLWGLDAQKRLRAASILIAGLGGLGAEITKNLVLAGVKEVTLLDHLIVTDSPNFFWLETDVGKNRAEASMAAAESLNPMVTVKVDTEPLNTKSESFFQSFTVICVTGEPTSTLLKLDQICRKNNIKFYSADVWGSYGYGFVDLGAQHTYVEEAKPKVSSKEKEKNTKEQITEMQQKTLDYPTLEKALSVKSGKVGSGIDKKTSSVLFITHIMLRFLEKKKRYPVSTNGSLQKDLKDLINLKEEALKELGIDSDRLSSECLENLFGEISPVCAIVGGIIAQDIIKAVSGKDQPIRNFFLFDGESCIGAVEYVGK